jgi:hypothetical protein
MKRNLLIREKIEEIISDYNNGLSSYVVADKFNVSRSLVATVLKEHGVKLRKGGARKGRIPWNKGKPYDAVRGSKNPRWKGGITELNSIIRHCIEYKNWRRAVFEKDNYTCVKCGLRGGELEVDHYPILFCELMQKYNIKSYDDVKNHKEFWNIDNGRVLCLKCHNRTFKFLGNQYKSVKKL